MEITSAEFSVNKSAEKMVTIVHNFSRVNLIKISLVKNCFSVFHSISHSGQVYYLTPVE